MIVLLDGLFKNSERLTNCILNLEPNLSFARVWVRDSYEHQTSSFK
jgi:hypothetical protein